VSTRKKTEGPEASVKGCGKKRKEKRKKWARFTRKRALGGRKKGHAEEKRGGAGQRFSVSRRR